MRRGIVIVLALISLVLVLTERGRPAPAADTEPQQKDLLARIAALEAVIPDQAHIMADVGDHFTNLWFAGGAENWPLAEFYLNETKSHLRWAVRAKPIRKDDQGHDINLGSILEAFENSQLTQLKQAIDGKDRPAFERVYRESLTVCYSCHKASDKPYLRPQIPAEPETRIINFDPKAKWPL
jgi:cytochrome c553